MNQPIPFLVKVYILRNWPTLENTTQFNVTFFTFCLVLELLLKLVVVFKENNMNKQKMIIIGGTNY